MSSSAAAPTPPAPTPLSRRVRGVRTRSVLLAGAGSALLAFALLWHAVLAERWTQRIPRGWSTRQHYIGAETYPDPKTGDFPEKDVIGEYVRGTRVISEADRPRSVLLEESNTVLTAGSDSVVWEYVTRAAVDPRTGAHIDPRYAGDIAVFPRNTQKRTYRLRANYLEGIPVAFERVEVLEGLATYMFSYHGRAEYTNSYRGSEQYPGVPLKAHEEVRCRDDQFQFRTWIEPTTGLLVKLEEGCPAGDYVHDTRTGAVGRPVSRWSGATAGDGLVESVARARAQRTRYLWLSYYLPLVCVLAGVALVAGALPWRRTRRPAVEAP